MDKSHSHDRTVFQACLFFLKVTLPYFVRSRGRAEAPSVNGLCGCVGHDVTAAAPLTADGFLPG